MRRKVDKCFKHEKKSVCRRGRKRKRRRRRNERNQDGNNAATDS